MALFTTESTRSPQNSPHLGIPAKGAVQPFSSPPASRYQNQCTIGELVSFINGVSLRPGELCAKIEDTTAVLNTIVECSRLGQVIGSGIEQGV